MYLQCCNNVSTMFVLYISNISRNINCAALTGVRRGPSCWPPSRRDLTLVVARPGKKARAAFGGGWVVSIAAGLRIVLPIFGASSSASQIRMHHLAPHVRCLFFFFLNILCIVVMCFQKWSSVFTAQV